MATIYMVANILVGCARDPSTTEAAPVPKEHTDTTIRPGPVLLDPRDNTPYPTVYVDTQLWMAKNLDFDTLDSTLTWCPDGKPEPGAATGSCGRAGRLYSWRAAMRGDSTTNIACDIPFPRTGICPAGWHLPSYDEWAYAIDKVGGIDSAGRRLKATSGWPLGIDGPSGNGMDSVGFAAVPAGFHFTGDQGYAWYGHTPSDSSFLQTKEMAVFWTSDRRLSTCWDSWVVYITKDYPSVTMDAAPRSLGGSVRCMRD